MQMRKRFVIKPNPNIIAASNNNILQGIDMTIEPMTQANYDNVHINQQINPTNKYKIRKIQNTKPIISKDSTFKKLSQPIKSSIRIKDREAELEAKLLGSNSKNSPTKEKNQKAQLNNAFDRIDSLEQKVDAIQTEQAYMNHKIDYMNHKIDSLEQKVDAIQTEQADMNHKIGSLEQKVARMNDSIDGLIQGYSKAQQHNEQQFKQLKSLIQNQNQVNLKHSIISKIFSLRSQGSQKSKQSCKSQLKQIIKSYKLFGLINLNKSPLKAKLQAAKAKLQTKLHK